MQFHTWDLFTKIALKIVVSPTWPSPCIWIRKSAVNEHVTLLKAIVQEITGLAHAHMAPYLHLHIMKNVFLDQVTFSAYLIRFLSGSYFQEDQIN